MSAVRPPAGLRVVVVDDEPLAREDLLHLLAAHGDVTVVASCGTGAEAVTAVRRFRPDVLLLDIRMPGVDGFGVVEQLAPDEMPWVVFVTAFDRFAIEAFRVRALDYLLKPVQAGRLADALSRAREHVRLRQAGDRDAAPPSAGSEYSSGRRPRYLAELLVRVGARDVVVRVSEIDWIQAEAYYVRLHVRGRSYLYRERMHVLEAGLDPRAFRRVHRSAIVNLARVREIVHDASQGHVVVLSTGVRVRTSQQRWMEFRDAMRERTRVGAG